MTYIQPHQNNNKINFLISFSAFFLVASAVFGVFLYNQLIDLRHEINNREKIVKQTEVENAELKNAFYRTVDSKNLEFAAREKFLVLENKPEYVKLNNGQSLATVR